MTPSTAYISDMALIAAVLSSTPQRVAPRELAPLLGVTSKTLENWRKAGKGPPFITFSRRKIRYDMSAVKAWLAGLATASTMACPQCGAIKPAVRALARRKEACDAQG